MRLFAFLALVAFAIYVLRPHYLKWKLRQRFREFEAEQRRKWERHRRE